MINVLETNETIILTQVTSPMECILSKKELCPLRFSRMAAK